MSTRSEPGRRLGLTSTPDSRRRAAEVIQGVVIVVATATACLALVVLGVRAAVYLNIRWDTVMYHLPFAAVRGGLDLPYDMNEAMRPFFDGFPPLPHVLQGLLWNVTGNVNATGLLNYLAFSAFLVYAHAVLHARIWVVALVALTAPMVVIHATTSYVDLFGNSFLAAGLATCAYLYLNPSRVTARTVALGLVGLSVAAWSKFLLLPVVGIGFVFLVAVFIHARPPRAMRRRILMLVALAAIIAAAPYVKNFVIFQNPFWPERIPLVGDLIPHLRDDIALTVATQRPPALAAASQPEVFVRSLFEWDLPTRYEWRPRWNIDQGNAVEGYRMGGFWNVGLVVYLGLGSLLLLLLDRRRGAVIIGASIVVLAIVSIIPQSNQLRYFLFIPLVWAAVLGMVVPRFGRAHPGIGSAILALIVGLFGYMVAENRVHYEVLPLDGIDAARAWGASAYWPTLERGRAYCAVGMVPIGILLAGPTMREYVIVDRTVAEGCPPGTTIVTIPLAAIPSRPAIRSAGMARGPIARGSAWKGRWATVARPFRAPGGAPSATRG